MIMSIVLFFICLECAFIGYRYEASFNFTLFIPDVLKLCNGLLTWMIWNVIGRKLLETKTNLLTCRMTYVYINWDIWNTNELLILFRLSRTGWHKNFAKMKFMIKIYVWNLGLLSLTPVFLNFFFFL